MTARILVAGIGNIFFGDDGFGVAVAQRLATRQLPDGVTVRDFGIRGLDLAYAMLDPYDAVILVDAAPRGRAPGTLSLLEVKPDTTIAVTPDAHGMDPVRVLALARELGAAPVPTYLVACEPAPLASEEEDPELVMALSAPVLAAVDGAVRMVEELVGELANREQATVGSVATVAHS